MVHNAQVMAAGNDFATAKTKKEATTNSRISDKETNNCFSSETKQKWNQMINEMAQCDRWKYAFGRNEINLGKKKKLEFDDESDA